MFQKKQNSCHPEIWGGIECTINRIGDDYYDQLQVAGHYERSSDIRRLGELGIKAIRYPILWERHQPKPDEGINWGWADRQLNRLRDEGITPIVGLVHHGSGPAYTDLSSAGFAEGLAVYAGLVAARYPWIEYYTPVNEPLTTARFSGLYGIWYPHYSDALQCMTMLLNQVKGIVRSMTAIRKVNPSAQLVQTEDLSFVHSTPALAYQAAFENQRRWLTYDLLCGKVDAAHPLWNYLIHIGVMESDLSFFIDNPCVPDVIGVNYYVTSERFLDDAVDKYPPYACGGNGRHRYADVDAVRVTERAGLAALLGEIWQRYKLPIAITEAHLNCTREQQLRWLKEIWVTACDAKQAGIDLRAVTSWALLGSHDWNSLLTRQDGCYESGAYMIRDGGLQLTAVGAMIKKLATEGDFNHPLLDRPGWWHYQEGFSHQLNGMFQPLLIAGSAPFNQQWCDICHHRGITCKPMLCPEGHLSQPNWQGLIGRYHPWGIIIGPDSGAGDELLPAEIAREQGLPCLSWEGSIIPDVEEAQSALDLFIDLAVMGETAFAPQLII